jgi:hypothetical protein
LKTLPRREACSDDDLFMRANRCPLWPGRLNRWVVRRTLLDKPTDAEMLKGAREVLAVWFAREHAWGVGELVANVRGLARRRAIQLVGEVAKTSDFLSPLPTMLADSFASLAVEFLYFGSETNMAWPVNDASGVWAPFDCVWALDLVGLPDGSRAA